MHERKRNEKTAAPCTRLIWGQSMYTGLYVLNSWKAHRLLNLWTVTFFSVRKNTPAVIPQQRRLSVGHLIWCCRYGYSVRPAFGSWPTSVCVYLCGLTGSWLVSSGIEASSSKPRLNWGARRVKWKLCIVFKTHHRPIVNTSCSVGSAFPQSLVSSFYCFTEPKDTRLTFTFT